MIKNRFCRGIVILISLGLLCACDGGELESTGDLHSVPEETYISPEESQISPEESHSSPEADESENIKTQWDKGYDLPINDSEKEEAETDCEKVMMTVAEIYRSADKGEASNIILADETMAQMKEVIKETGAPVISSETYSNMENYEKMEKFLIDSEQGKAGEIILYEINWDGGIDRAKYSYDGTDMYLLSAKAAWNTKGEPIVTYISHTRIKEWQYTEKGYFCYELCVPEPPDVTEIVDGSSMVRVKPLSDACRERSKQCVFPLGYQGNNLLCSNWNIENLENLDYNGMYEYLYGMKYGKGFDSESYSDGIPKEEFENLIMEYLPVTAEQIREWAVFDEEHQTYAWARLGCMNYVPTFFGTSFPEVVEIKKNEDGTETLTVDAVCDMVVHDDAVITHELIVRFSEDGSFMYLGNEILKDGIADIPEYQYRFERERSDSR